MKQRAGLQSDASSNGVDSFSRAARSGAGELGTVPGGRTSQYLVLPSGISSCLAGIGMGTGDECSTSRLDERERLRRITSKID